MWCPVVPLFNHYWKDSLCFASLYCLCCYILDQFTVFMWVYFCVLYSVPVILLPTPHCPGDCSFIVSLKVSVILPTLLISFNIELALSWSIFLESISLKTCFCSFAIFCKHSSVPHVSPWKEWSYYVLNHLNLNKPYSSMTDIWITKMEKFEFWDSKNLYCIRKATCITICCNTTW